MDGFGSFAVSFAVACASLTAGCGCDPGNNSQRAPVQFTPSSVSGVRTPSTCGISDPSFTANDTFTLKLLGETDVAPPYTLITLSFPATAHLNQAVPLMVNQGSEANVTSASSTDGSLQFSFQVGSNAAELDGSPLASVVVTVTALPSADGQPLGAELRLTFEDGRALDQAYSAPLQTVSAACK